MDMVDSDNDDALRDFGTYEEDDELENDFVQDAEHAAPILFCVECNNMV